jgi:hypothetical protein
MCGRVSIDMATKKSISTLMELSKKVAKSIINPIPKILMSVNGRLSFTKSLKL